MTISNPTAHRRPCGAATALLWSLLAAAATTASGAAPFTCPGGATCKNWNDGCNDCGAGDDGSEACTEMWCACLDDGSCPAPKCLDVEGCKPIEKDPAQISIGGNLKAEDDFVACLAIWEPVCGSDDRVYSNACEAGSKGQQVKYEISPNDSVTSGKDCPPEKGDPAQISIGGNLKAEDDITVCTKEFKPVCGSDGRVYSNACEAGAKGQEVEYEFSPDDNVTAGKNCSPEKPAVTVAMESCGSMRGCVDCVGGGCTWAAGECMSDCLVADVPCYTPGGLQYAGSAAKAQGDETPAEVCQLEADAKADVAACNLKSCGECVATALPSDKTKTCRWFGFAGGFCGSACGLAGCGETECPLQGEGDKDITVCTKEFNPVCGSDDKVYSNTCEAEAAGQRVQYEIKAPGDIKSVGQDCPIEDEKPAVTLVTMESCGSMSACADCVGGGCAWTADECMPGCLVADAACYTSKGDETPAQVCLAEAEAKADAAACNVKGCEECVSMALPSDKTKTCMWFDGESCGSACGLAGCGETKCPQGGGEVDPIVCTKEWKPVCGSDDKVYGNACMAEAAGQEVQYEIESPDDNVTAGKDCPPESVDPQGGGDEDLIACDAEWKPVCGSDDKVYSNACTAEAAGQDVQYEIESPDDSVTAGKDCPPESVDPQGGDDEDLIVCTEEWKPVCGSDDKVYGNACEAEAEGQDVQYEIESPDDSVTAGKDCPPESPAKAVPEEEEDPLEDEDDSAGDRVVTWHHGMLLVLHLAAAMMV